MTPPASNVAGNKSDLTEVLKTQTDLADRLRESEPKSPKKRKMVSRIHAALKRSEQELVDAVI